MPPKFKFTREEIIQAALDLTRESGIAAVTARGLGAKLGSSVKPIFSLFENMEEIDIGALKRNTAREKQRAEEEKQRADAEIQRADALEEEVKRLRKLLEIQGQK